MTPLQEAFAYPAEGHDLLYSHHSSELDLGIGLYFTSSPGIGGRIKRDAQDFIVKEDSFPPQPTPDGEFTIATITSTNWETNRLVRKISRRLGISRSRIGFAGTKDKRAITTQLFSFMRVGTEAVEDIGLTDVLVEDIYTARRGMKLGDLRGNTFEITIRELDGDWKDVFALTAEQLEAAGGVPNYFGIQRFGAVRPVTHLVGKHMVNGNFRDAALAYLGHPFPLENEKASAARTLIDTGEYREAMNAMPPHMSFERAMLDVLIRDPEDHVGAIKALPSNLTLMFIHAYQSLLFNRTLTERMKRGLPIREPVEGDLVLPMSKSGVPEQSNPQPVSAANIGKVSKLCRRARAFVSVPCFGQNVPLAEGEPGEIERKIIEEEGIEADRFIIPEIPRLTTSGIRREAFAHIMEPDLRVLDPGSARLSFRLFKGNYATIVVREFTKGNPVTRS